MRDCQPPAVEPDMASESIKKGCDGFAKAAILGCQLINTLLQAMGDGDLAAREPALELAIVITLDSISGASGSHAHHDAQHIRRVWTPIDEVANKDQLPPFGRSHRD